MTSKKLSSLPNIIQINAPLSPQVAGFISASAGANAPSGWAFCDGSTLDKTTYEQLFARIGATWDACTNPLTGAAYSAPGGNLFRLPDLRGTFLRGAGDFADNTMDTVLGGFQANKTAKNSLDLTGSVAGGTASLAGSVSHDLSVATQSLGVPTTNTGTGPVANPGAYLMTPGYSNTGSANSGWSGNISHAHGLSGGVNNGSLSVSNTAASNGTLAVGTGDSETRPQNVGVNYLIKLYDDAGAISMSGTDLTVKNLIVKNEALIPNVSYQNFLINGGFDFWQRGISFASSGYSADRWYFNNNTTNCSCGRNTAQLPDARTKQVFGWYTTGSSSYGTLEHCLESADVILLRGKQVTFSIDIKTAGTAFVDQMLVIAYSSDSTDARTSQTTPLFQELFTPPTAFMRRSFTFTIPIDALGLRLSIDCNTLQPNGVEVYIGNAMLNIGSQAAPFSRAGGTIGGELALCQRYYEKSYPINIAPATNSDAGRTVVFAKAHPSAQIFNATNSIKFAVVKRADPGSIWFFSKDGSSDIWSSDIGIPGTCYASTHCDSNFEVGCAVGSGFSANAMGYALGHWVADAEL